MNEIIKKSLLTGDIFKPEVHLRQSRFTYSDCRTFTKIKKIRDLRYIHKKKLDKACF